MAVTLRVQCITSYAELLGLREDARKLQGQILRALTERLAAAPQEALP